MKTRENLPFSQEAISTEVSSLEVQRVLLVEEE